MTELSDDAKPLDLVGRLIGPPRGVWGQRIATTTAAVATGRALWQTIQARRLNHDYTVSINENDELYAPVQDWVLARMPADQQKALIAHTTHNGELLRDDSSGRLRPGLRFYYDGSRQQTVVIGGHQIQVGVERETGGGGTEDRGFKWRPDRIVFASKTSAGREAVKTFLAGLADELARSRTTPRLYTATKWGDWQSSRDMMPRPLDSVVLRAGLMEDLVADLEDFYRHEADYVRLGIPWHRGYLFHGPPGTGKTSAAKALAAHLGLDMYYVPLADMKSDTDLDSLVARVDSRAVLLLEDIDVLRASRERDDSIGGLTMTGLLNALDGVVTPHGLVTVMTTNDLSAIDTALTRKGRADRTEYMGVLDADQFCRLVKTLTGMPPLAGHSDDVMKVADLTAAEVVDVDGSDGAMECYCHICGQRVTEMWTYWRDPELHGFRKADWEPTLPISQLNIVQFVGCRLRPCGHYVTRYLFVNPEFADETHARWPSP